MRLGAAEVIAEGCSTTIGWVLTISQNVLNATGDWLCRSDDLRRGFGLRGLIRRLIRELRRVPDSATGFRSFPISLPFFDWKNSP